jgi:hypothetical protein
MPPGVDVFRAATADHEGLAPPLGHQVHPRGSLVSAWLVEVGEFADMVHLKVPIRVTDLAAHCQLIRG